jgi:GTP cyclohydrolase I-like protein
MQQRRARDRAAARRSAGDVQDGESEPYRFDELVADSRSLTVAEADDRRRRDFVLRWGTGKTIWHWLSRPQRHKIADEPRGIAVWMGGVHLCMVMRGVEQGVVVHGGQRGAGEFLNDERTRQEFMSIVNRRGQRE